MRLRDLYEDINWDLIDALHEPRGRGFWVTPNTIDLIMPRGIHDQLSYGAFPRPEDKGVYRDDIPWTARAFEAGWIRGRTSQEGAELNLMFIAAPAIIPTLKKLDGILRLLDVLSQVHLEVWAPGQLITDAHAERPAVRPEAKQIEVKNPRLVLSTIRKLAK